MGIRGTLIPTLRHIRELPYPSDRDSPSGTAIHNVDHNRHIRGCRRATRFLIATLHHCKDTECHVSLVISTAHEGVTPCLCYTCLPTNSTFKGFS